VAPTLAALLAVPGLGLRVLAGAGPRGEGLRRRLTWAASSELTDPTPYLEGGELVLLTGLGADLDAGAAAYVDRLVAAGVGALGFGVGVVHPVTPPALVAAADAAGLPLLEVDRPTPFVAVGKALADLLAREQGERTRRRLEGMRALTARLSDGGTDPALRRLADLVGGWCALLDARGRPEVVTGRSPRLDVAAGLAAQLARPTDRRAPGSAAQSDSDGRVTVLPVGLRERPHAFLAVGAGSGADLDHHLVAFAASLLTLDVERSRARRPAHRWARAAALARVLDADAGPPPPEAAGPLADGSAAVRAIVLRLESEEVRPALDALADDSEVATLPLPGGGECLLVVLDEAVDDVLRAVADVAGPVAGGVSAPVAAGDRDGLRAAVEEARSLAGRARDGVLVAGQAPPSLIDVLGPRAAAAFAQAVLGPLRREPDGDVLVAALRVHLAAHGALALAADRLGVHRHTLRARLRRAASLLGKDLDDAGVRAELWVALAAGDH